MRRSSLWLCMLGIVLWVGVLALAQGQQGPGGAAGQVRQRAGQAGGAQTAAPAADANAATRARAARQDDSAMRAARGAAQDANAAGAQRGKALEDVRAKAKDQRLDQQVQSLQKQIQEAKAKHMERTAKLNRIRELAVKKGDNDMVARVDKLIAKEKEVFGHKQNPGQPRATAGPNDVGGRRGPAGSNARTDVKEQKAPEAKPATPK